MKYAYVNIRVLLFIRWGKLFSISESSYIQRAPTRSLARTVLLMRSDSRSNSDH